MSMEDGMKSFAMLPVLLAIGLLLSGSLVSSNENWIRCGSDIQFGGQPESDRPVATDGDNPSGPRGILGMQERKRTIIVNATAYNADRRQTDSTPTICAWGDKPRAGTIAVSRDLERMGLTRGKEVHVEGIGWLTVLDRMHQRKSKQIDIFMKDREEAVQFGNQKVTILWHEKKEETI
jgi:3D (Asp-Asp-Asp) domain-containing protein